MAAPPSDGDHHAATTLSNAAKRTTVQSEAFPLISRNSNEQMFFEIGKFKQQDWAAEESSKVAKLGFPSTVLRRGHLWMNSYHVLVGPYSVREEAEAAHKDLLSRGFNAKPFERGSREIALPARLTLHGTQAPAGDCVIRWESYIDNVKVRFEQDDHIVATAEGKWVSRDPKYEHNATVYMKKADGSRTLVELRFEGMTRALVFQ